MNSTNDQPPFLGPQFPVYPQLGEAVRISGIAVAANVYPGFLQQSTHGPGLRDRIPVFIYNPNGTGVSTELPTGYYLARLIDEYTNGGNTYPLYTVGLMLGSSNSYLYILYVTNLYVTNLYVTQILLQYTSFNLTLSTYNNFNVAGQSKILFTATGPVTISGFAGALPGQLLFLLNLSSSPITLTNQDLASNPASRVMTPWVSSYILWPGREIILQYDGITARWRFAHPTLAVGSVGAIQTYGCDYLIVGPHMTSTDNGDGSNTIDAIIPAPGVPTLVHGESGLAAAQGLTNAYVSNGGTVNLPTAGKYLVTAQVNLTIGGFAMVAPIINCRLFNTTTSTAFGVPSEHSNTWTSGTFLTTCPLVGYVTTTTINNVIAVQGKDSQAVSTIDGGDMCFLQVG